MKSKSLQLLFALGDTAKEASESAAALADTGIDAVLEEGALDGIPIVSSAIGILKIRDAYVSARLKRNVAALYNAARSGNKEKITACFDEISRNSEHYTDFVDTALSIIIESHRPLKASLLGRLIVALSEQKITYEEYDELTLIVAEGSIAALRDVPRYFELEYARICEGTQNSPRPTTAHLVSLGLMTLNSMPQKASKLGVNMYLHAFGGSEVMAKTVFQNHTSPQ
jgi:hypothetical protein